MSKRKSQEKIDYYAEKIKTLQKKQYKRRLRSNVIYSDSSESEQNSDNNCPANEITTESVIHETNESLENVPQTIELMSDTPNTDPNQDGKTEESVPELEAEILFALGDSIDESPKYGEKIHPDLAKRWLPLLSKGILEKETKEKLLKEYVVPENCKLLRAPCLNPEISAAMTDAARSRDKKTETAQHQLGLGITAINRAMSLLLTVSDDEKANKIRAIKILSDSCRILSDLHYNQTQTRVKLLTPALDKSFLNIIQYVERDETLFGCKLSEKIKASKTIEKQGLQIKKPSTNTKTPTPSTSNSTSFRPRFQGNWTSSSRPYQTANRVRGAQKSQAAARKNHTVPTQTTKFSSYHKQPRAPPTRQ